MGSIYSMTKRADGWVISVGNDELLTCSRRATAICVIRQAAGRLDLLGEAFASSLNACRDETGSSVPRPAT
jgi:hypothetical protein